MITDPLVLPDPAERLAMFKEALVSDQTDEALVDQYVLHGSCFAIAEDQHYALKDQVSRQFGLEIHQDVFVVGSAKLGFSIAPHKRYREFGDRSDIDLAIVSHELYQRVWHEAHSYSESGVDWPRRRDFESYTAWGWIRPDKLPSGASFAFSTEWWRFFRALQQSRRYGPYKIAAGLYHDVGFLRKYQMRAISACRSA